MKNRSILLFVNFGIGQIQNVSTVGKRVTILFVVILVSALAILGYFFYQGRMSLFTDPYKAVTPEACIVIETSDLPRFFNSVTTGNGFFEEAGRIKELGSFNMKLKYLAGQVNKEEYKKLLTGTMAIISF